MTDATKKPPTGKSAAAKSPNKAGASKSSDSKAAGAIATDTKGSGSEAAEEKPGNVNSAGNKPRSEPGSVEKAGEKLVAGPAGAKAATEAAPPLKSSAVSSVPTSGSKPSGEAPAAKDTAKDTAKDKGSSGKGESAAAKPAAAPPARDVRRSGFTAGVILGVAVVFAVMAGMVYFQPQWAPYAESWIGPASGDRQALGEQVTALGSRIDGLEAATRAAVDNAQAAVDNAQAAVDYAEAAAQTAAEAAVASAMESAVASAMAATGDDSGPALRGIEQRLSDLDARLAALSAAATAGRGDSQLAQDLVNRMTLLEGQQAANQALANEVASLQEQLSDSAAMVSEIAAMRKAVASLEGELAARGSAGDPQTSALLGLLQLRDTLRGGAPFTDEMTLLKQQAATDAQLAALIAPLEPYAASGVPTIQQLRAGFPAIARQVVIAAAGAEDEGWLAGIKRRLTDVVTIRPVGGSVEGDEPAAVVARAESKLAANDLSGAVSELAALEGPPADAAAEWVAAAQARVVAHEALSALGARLTASTQASGS